MSTFVNKNVGLKPRLLTWEATVVSRGDRLYLRISPGTVNNILPANWQSELEVTGQGVKYVCLKVLSTSNSNRVVVTGAEFVIRTSAPPTDTPSLGSPPSETNILLGVFFEGLYKAIYTKPLFMYPSVFYTVPKSNPSAFAFPYDKYFVWEVVS